MDKEVEIIECFENIFFIIDVIKWFVSIKLFFGCLVNWEYEWVGIMGVGEEKRLFIEFIDNWVVIGLCMGGMGVVIGM